MIFELDSFYLNDLGYKDVHISDAKQIEIDNQKTDKFNFIKRLAPNRIFSIKKNSWVLYETIDSAKEHIKKAIYDIENDDRYNDYIKKGLIKYANSLKIVEITNEPQKK